MLEARGLVLAYGSEPLLSDLHFSLPPGSVTAVVGPNGAGKSTLLRALFGDHRAAAGEILLDGTAFRAERRRGWQSRIGYMPQDERARTGLTVLETVLLGAIEHLSLRLSDELLQRAIAALAQVGQAGLADRPIETLSGGQRQLVFFAQALLRDPRLTLLDEPVSALDLRHQQLLLGEVVRLTRDRGMVTVVVLHDLNLAARFADRILVLHGGRLHAEGAPAEVLGADLLSPVYGVEVVILRDPDGLPWVTVRGPAPTDRSRNGL